MLYIICYIFMLFIYTHTYTHIDIYIYICVYIYVTYHYVEFTEKTLRDMFRTVDMSVWNLLKNLEEMFSRHFNQMTVYTCLKYLAVCHKNNCIHDRVPNYNYNTHIVESFFNTILKTLQYILWGVYSIIINC